MGMGPGIELLEFVGLFGVFGVGLLEAYLTHPRPEPVRATLYVREASNPRCPYCHAAFGEEECLAPQLSCRRCHTVHHVTCWAGHGGCSVYACEPTRPPRARLVGTQPEPAPWEGPRQEEVTGG